MDIAANDDLISIAGVRVPRILYGTAWKQEATASLVVQALRMGFRGVDTAAQPRHYHEAGVGAALAVCRKEGIAREALYLQTKFTPLGGQDPQRLPYDPAAPIAEQVRQSFHASLDNLQTDYVDALVLHSPLATTPQLREAWQAMERIVDADGARQLGISNCHDLEYLQALHAVARIKPAIVQNRFHAPTGYDLGIRAFCRQHGLVYQSFWTLTANPQLLAHPLITALAARHRRSPAQILFRYLVQDGAVPLTGTTSALHMREDLAIFEFELGQAERVEVTSVLAQLGQG
jgi:diketogulonate reductase-like aldo/keto reductase